MSGLFDALSEWWNTRQQIGDAVTGGLLNAAIAGPRIVQQNMEDAYNGQPHDDYQQVRDAQGLLGYAATGAMPFAQRGALGALGGKPAGLLGGTAQPAAAGVFPIAETATRAASREALGFPTITRVPAQALKDAYEADQKEPLAWSPGRATNINNLLDAGTSINDYPRVGYYRGRVGVDDGRHRISVAADRNQLIDVAVGSPAEATALQSRLTPGLLGGAAPAAGVGRVVAGGERIIGGGRLGDPASPQTLAGQLWQDNRGKLKSALQQLDRMRANIGRTYYVPAELDQTEAHLRDLATRPFVSQADMDAAAQAAEDAADDAANAGATRRR